MGEPDDGIFFRMHTFLLREHHLKAAINQKSAEQIKQPFKALDQADAGQDHQSPHDQRAQDPPKQHAMLVLGRDAKIGEDQRDDEHIVHRQGQFSDVTGDEQQRFLFAHVWLHEGEGKNQRQAKPNHGPGERFLEPDDVSATMKHPQVQRQEGEVYRESLVAKALALGVGDYVRFVDRYLSLAELLEHRDDEDGRAQQESGQVDPDVLFPRRIFCPTLPPEARHAQVG